MNQIQRHIEILLLDHDCVIVPGFGGFVAHQVPAHYEAADRMFLPPTRTLGFNSQLTINDSLLVQSYIEAYDISYPAALRRIEDEVTSIKHQLSTVGSFALSDLGTLVVNADGNYEFSPCEAGILSPAVYGLGSFFFKHLGDQAEEPVATPAAQLLNIVHTAESDVKAESDVNAKSEEAPSEEVSSEASLLEFFEQSDDENRAIRIRMSWIRNAVAVAAAILVFFLFATPVVNSDLGNQAMSQLQGNLMYRLMPKDSNMVPAEPVKAEPRPVVAQTPEREAEPSQSTERQQPVQQPTTTPQSNYCIVVASQVKLSNAESFVQQLHQQGYPEARVYIHNHIVRVICGEYPTQAEAYTQLNKLNDKQEFAEAWVYKKAAI